MDELKPCPFCGGEAILMHGAHAWEIHCLPCTASVSEMTKAEAIAAWNTRPTPDSAGDVVDYEPAWREMHDALSWMQESRALNRYLGWNFAHIANDLIDKAYPGLRDGKAALTDRYEEGRKAGLEEAAKVAEDCREAGRSVTNEVANRIANAIRNLAGGE